MGEQGISAAVKAQEGSLETLQRMAEVADVEAVFGEPVASGDFTVITAAEVSASLGFGFGIGSGDKPQGEGQSESGSGGGGGGGGYTTGRPVAVVVAGPNGVRVEPVLDLTKVGLAFLTMIGSLIVMINRMNRALRG